MDATVVAIAGGGDDSVRRPLVSLTEEIHPYAEPPSPQRPLLDAAAAQPEQQRVASLDVFRGFTVAMMILVVSWTTRAGRVRVSTTRRGSG